MIIREAGTGAVYRAELRAGLMLRVERSYGGVSTWGLDPGDDAPFMIVAATPEERQLLGEHGVTPSEIDFKHWELHQESPRGSERARRRRPVAPAKRAKSATAASKARRRA